MSCLHLQFKIWNWTNSNFLFCIFHVYYSKCISTLPFILTPDKHHTPFYISLTWSWGYFGILQPRTNIHNHHLGSRTSRPPRLIKKEKVFFKELIKYAKLNFWRATGLSFLPVHRLFSQDCFCRHLEQAGPLV